MKNLLFKKLNKYSLLVFLFYLFYQVPNVSSQEKKIHSLPIKQKFIEEDKFAKDLIPMPAGDINKSAMKVNFDRNPFQKPSKSEFPTIQNLYSSLLFKGLAQSDKKLFAIIETEKGQSFYEVGDSLENGFTIQSISLQNTTVDITNGTKNYRLTLADIKNLI
mgnify:CR=1 FL=1